MTYQDILKNEEINAFIKKGSDNLQFMGYTDHSAAHTALVAERAGMILEKLGKSEHQIELAKIAGYMHDIGNAVNRKNHAEYGAILANEILRNTDMPFADKVQIVSTIGLHDESTGGAVDDISAAVIIADKTDVRRNRVRSDRANFDIHDRVNYAVTNTELKIDTEEMTITLELEVDEDICSMFDYFDIFLGRMMMCRKAAEVLGTKFMLMVNGSKVL